MNTALAEPVLNKTECVASMRNVLDALYVLNGKWKLPLILSLVHGPKRFGGLQQELTGISPKVLAKELKELELNDFIVRDVQQTTPVTITYSASEYSRTLRNVLYELDAWGAQHRERIRQSLRRTGQPAPVADAMTGGL